MAENRIIIFGGSWATGEHTIGKGVTHPGLNLYLEEAGYKVINFAQAARSSQGIYVDIETHLDEFLEDDIVLCVEPDPLSDSYYEKLEEKIIDHDGLINYVLHLRTEHYNRINSLPCKLNLIGGMSNVDPSRTHHNVVVPSWINLMTGTEISEPPDFFALELSKLIVNVDKRKFNNNEFEKFIEDLSILKLRDKLFNTEWFKKERYHPDRNGHKILVDELVKKLKL